MDLPLIRAKSSACSFSRPMRIEKAGYLRIGGEAGMVQAVSDVRLGVGIDERNVCLPSGEVYVVLANPRSSLKRSLDVVHARLRDHRWQA